MKRRYPALLTFTLFILLAAGCGGEEEPSASGMNNVACDPDNGGLQLPEGFCAMVVADSLGRGRHIAVSPSGDIYLKLSNAANGGIVALRDTTGDGRPDRTERFAEFAGTGIEVQGGYLYASSDSFVVRYPLASGELAPSAPYEMIASQLPERGQHASKSFALDGNGGLYVNVGVPSNACQVEDRVEGSPGQDPCPLLENFGGIWRFRADAPGQTFADGARFATGIRNAVAIAWNDNGGNLYAAQHGRDQLTQNWPEMYTVEESAELPAEELFLVQENDDFGWPYCYYDGRQNKKVLAPEYGGDKTEVGQCDQFRDPIVAFPAHYAPNDLVFYGADQFPEKYRKGAFIAFHGSWNRAPLPQQGFNVVFVPFDGAQPSGDWEVFADGFAGQETIPGPGDADFRPTGLAVGPDGSLYISDSVKGKIWRVMYKG